ncbi:hypothetical protein M422DRAFT_261669 [Sphaerobolus stellatus SS14]|uniref:Unplaced genomic scaffold SPHSTscaffold_108, whole genome shotgun sequence n=1 Tax=Sphaerobolus stellatus (strain SS14) TaxID=990650 RepID=A0A0C9UM83_SPHS4|nr:hypothetical protein M422DRAFT_261669 [Sphaerobolus stellatus SS14]
MSMHEEARQWKLGRGVDGGRKSCSPTELDELHTLRRHLSPPSAKATVDPPRPPRTSEGRIRTDSLYSRRITLDTYNSYSSNTWDVSPRCTILINLLRRLYEKRVRFRSVSSRHTISTRSSPGLSPLPAPRRVLRRVPPSTIFPSPPRTACPPSPPRRRSLSPPRRYRPNDHPAFDTHPPRARSASNPPPSVHHRAHCDATPVRQPSTARSRLHSVRPVPSSPRLAARALPSHPVAAAPVPPGWSHPRTRAPLIPRTAPLSPLDYDSDPSMPTLKRNSPFPPFKTLGRKSKA